MKPSTFPNRAVKSPLTRCQTGLFGGCGVGRGRDDGGGGGGN